MNEIVEKLKSINKELFTQFGTESYSIRCKIFDIITELQTGVKDTSIPATVWKSEQLKKYAEFLAETPSFEKYSNKDLSIDYCDSF